MEIAILAAPFAAWALAMLLWHLDGGDDAVRRATRDSREDFLTKLDAPEEDPR